MRLRSCSPLLLKRLSTAWQTLPPDMGYQSPLSPTTVPNSGQQNFEYCKQHGVTYRKVTPKWAQADGEIKRWNRSLLKRLQIAQVKVYQVASTPETRVTKNSTSRRRIPQTQQESEILTAPAAWLLNTKEHFDSTTAANSNLKK